MRGCRADRVADGQVGQALAERVHVGLGALRAGRPLAGDRGQHVGRGLDRGALHVVQHAADAAELLAATGATGAAVDEHRQRGAVAGGLAGVVAVEHEDAAVPRREAERHGARDGRVVGDHRADEAARAAGGQRDRLVEVVVASSPCDTGRTARRRAARWHPRRPAAAPGDMNAPRSASASITSTVSGSPNTISAEPRSAWTALRTSSRWSRLASAPIRTSSLVGLPTVIFAEPRRDRLGDRRRRSRPARSTRRIAVHFWPALTVISVTTALTNRSNSGSSGVTSGPRIEQFSESASTPRRTPPWSTAGCWRRWAPVAAEPVNATESWAPSSSSRPAGLPHRSWSDALGEDAGLDDAAYDQLGEVRRLAGRLHDGRQPGQERRRELLEEAPDREVERVDLHGDARDARCRRAGRGRCPRGRAARPGRRGRRCRWAARGCPWRRRRRRCRCRRRCRPPSRAWSRRSARRARRTRP